MRSIIGDISYSSVIGIIINSMSLFRKGRMTEQKINKKQIGEEK